MDPRTAFALTLSLLAPAGGTLPVLRQVERRYNAARTLEVRFTQIYRGAGQPARTENGILFLLKPGRMRWEYRNPEGKLFVSDGRTVWFYSPSMNQVEKSPLKANDDLRAPLAFLLGNLDFARDFQDFRANPAEEGGWRIIAAPRSKNSPYREVLFTLSGQAEFRSILVTGADGGQMEFRFEGERLNPPMAASRFVYVPPPGVEVVTLN
jgi:chaperone LolA